MYIEVSNTTADKAITDRLGQLLGEEDPYFFAEVEKVIGPIEWFTMRLTPLDGGYSRAATFFGEHVGEKDSPTKTAAIMQDGDDGDDFYASRDALLVILKKMRGRQINVQIEPGGRLFDNEEPIPGRKPGPVPPPAEPIIQAAPMQPEIHVHFHLHTS